MPYTAQQQRDISALLMRQMRSEAANIGMPPRRQGKFNRLFRLYKNDLPAFLSDCFPNSTGKKPFGQNQLDAIDRTQKALTRGMKVVNGEPRGYAKTTRSANSTLWAVCYGHRRCIPLLSGGLRLSTKIMKHLKSELQGNEYLAGLFPGIHHCFKALGNVGQRGKHQHIDGMPTEVTWTAETIGLPMLPDDIEAEEPGQGSVIAVLPIGSARGYFHTRSDGTVLRPDFVFLDDVESKKISKNPRLIEDLIDLIKTDILFLSGHSKSLAAVMNGTVLAPNDQMEHFLSAEPGWLSSRYKMLEKPSDNEHLWLGKYADILHGFVPNDPESQTQAAIKALEYYEANREAMDKGAVVSWEWAYNFEDEPQVEISAIQHAYNKIIIDGFSSFATECQNSPIETAAGDFTPATVQEIRQKVNPTLERGIVPEECKYLVAGMDAQKRMLFWVVSAYWEDFCGHVVDYNTWPPQRQVDFEYRNAEVKLQDMYPDAGFRGAMRRGLDECIEGLLTRKWQTPSGVSVPLRLVVIDRGYQGDVVKPMIEESIYRPLLMPALGRGITASSTPIEELNIVKGEEKGHGYIIKNKTPKFNMRGMQTDSNEFKTRVHEGFTTVRGDPGCLTLFNPGNLNHNMFARHLANEYPEEHSVNGRKKVVWKEYTHKPDQHWFDAEYLTMAGASYLGCEFPGGVAKKSTLVKRTGKRLTQTDIERMRRRRAVQ